MLHPHVNSPASAGKPGELGGWPCTRTGRGSGLRGARAFGGRADTSGATQEGPALIVRHTPGPVRTRWGAVTWCAGVGARHKLVLLSHPSSWWSPRGLPPRGAACALFSRLQMDGNTPTSIPRGSRGQPTLCCLDGTQPRSFRKVMRLGFSSVGIGPCAALATAPGACPYVRGHWGVQARAWPSVTQGRWCP